MTLVLTRATKQAARYTDAGGRERCSGCRFFMPQGTCGRIIGPVSPRGWCKYYSMEAVQRWQPQGAVGFGGGSPPGLTLDLGFINPGQPLDSRITFTRASTGTYFDNTGTVQTAAVNAPRWDYAGGVLRGLLIEESRQNLWLQSADASNAAWIPASTGGPVVPVVTGNQTTAPDGTLTAARAVYPAVNIASSYSVLYQAITATAAPYAFSMWLKGAVGGEQIYVASLAGPGTRAILTTQWQRFTYLPSLSVGTNYLMVGTDLRTPQTSTPAQTVYVWGGQLELGAFPTSYIPTAAVAVTRAVDLCTIQPANMGFCTPPGGSWAAELIPSYLSSTFPRVIFTLPSTDGVGPIIFDGSAHGAQYDGTGLPATANAATAGLVTRMASAAAPTPGRVCLNGGAIASAAMGSGYPAIVASGVGFFVGSTGASPLNAGYLRRVRYWPRVLSDTELQSVTT